MRWGWGWAGGWPEALRANWRVGQRRVNQRAEQQRAGCAARRRAGAGRTAEEALLEDEGRLGREEHRARREAVPAPPPPPPRRGSAEMRPRPHTHTQQTHLAPPRRKGGTAGAG